MHYLDSFLSQASALLASFSKSMPDLSLFTQTGKKHELCYISCNIALYETGRQQRHSIQKGVGGQGEELSLAYQDVNIKAVTGLETSTRTQTYHTGGSLCYFLGETHRISHPELSGGIATLHSEAATQRWLSLCLSFKMLLQSILGLHSSDKVSINPSLSLLHLQIPPLFSDHLAMSGLTHCDIDFGQEKLLCKGCIFTQTSLHI